MPNNKPNMPVNYQLRPAMLNDIPALHQHCWQNKSLSFVQGFVERCVNRLASNGRGATVVATLPNTQAIGFGLFTRWTAQSSEISDLIVAPTLRSKGVGSAMIRYLLNKAQKLGVSTIEIGAAHSNPRARILYERLGFKHHRTLTLRLEQGLEPVDYLIWKFEE